MHVTLTDNQIVNEYESCLFTMMAIGLDDVVIVLSNHGINTMNYRFQEFNGTSWRDIGGPGTEVYSTLMSDQSRTIRVTSKFSQIRLMGNASGGSMLNFTMVRSHNRASGGPIPIVGL